MMPGPPLTKTERREAWPWLSDAQALELEAWLRQRDDAWLTASPTPSDPQPWPEAPGA
jgi:hypothetical protein